jgi:homogentisate 1,2-dioxygenase
MTPHGPDAEAFEAASTAELKPRKLTGTMAFMFESKIPQRVTEYASKLDGLQADYVDCWRGLKRRFIGKN